MKKLTYLIACTVDGFIARENGAIDDFTMDGEHVADLLNDYPEMIPTHLREYFDIDYTNKTFDTVLMGKATHELGLNQGYPSPYQHLEQYVFSRSLPRETASDITFIADEALDVVRELKRQDGLGIWLCGGSQLATALFSEIDELVIKSNPFLMGAGKSLFAEPLPQTELEVTDRRDYANGFALITYKLRHSDQNP